MIDLRNRLIDEIETSLGGDIDIETLTAAMGPTDYHVRRMISSLAGMPLSEYVRRRRRRTAAASGLVGHDKRAVILARSKKGTSIRVIARVLDVSVGTLRNTTSQDQSTEMADATGERRKAT